jgi:hypothetical protein
VAARSAAGVAWPGGAPCTFDLAEVRALGKQSLHGSFVTRLLVRLADGREAFVVTGEQSADEQAWLKKLSRRELAARRSARIAGSAGGYPTRDCPEVIHWIEVEVP